MERGLSCYGKNHLLRRIPWNWSRVPRVRLRNSTPALVNRLLLGGYGAAGGGGDGAGGGKYIMPLVKLSFYDHFMVARGPSMLSTYRCAFLAAVLCAIRLVSTRHRPLSSYASPKHCNRFRKLGCLVPPNPRSIPCRKYHSHSQLDRDCLSGRELDAELDQVSLTLWRLVSHQELKRYDFRHVLGKTRFLKIRYLRIFRK